MKGEGAETAFVRDFTVPHSVVAVKAWIKQDVCAYGCFPLFQPSTYLSAPIFPCVRAHVHNLALRRAVAQI